jgi:alpha-tubulin suppressor-like RCC1 family protein
MARIQTSLWLAALALLLPAGLGAAEPAGKDAPAVPVNGTFFTPVTKPTPMFFKPPPEAPLLAAPVNAGLSRIAPSEYHEFFIVNGKLLAIGGNRAGEMGIGHSEPITYVLPQKVAVPEDLTFVEAAAGGYQSVAVDSTGRVWSWGSNVFGQRGDGSVPDAETIKGGKALKSWGVPVQLTTDADGKDFGGKADPVVQVISTLWFNMARTTGGAVYMWGMNGDDGAGSDSRGIVGDGKPLADAKPTGDKVAICSVRRPSRVIFPEGTGIVYLAASSSMAVAEDKNGGLWTWGGGGFGLGVGDRGPQGNNSSTPLPLKQGRVKEKGPLSPLPRFVTATTNTGTNFAIDENSDLWGWGMIGPRLGLAASDAWNPQAYPVKLTRSGNPHFAGIDGLLTAGHKLTSVQASLNSVHVLCDDGSLWGWGDAAMGEVGDGHVVNYLQVTPKDGKNVVRCAWDWGGTKSMVLDATRILTHVRSFATTAFSFHVMAVREDGTIYAWGRNANGVLGIQMTPYDPNGPALKAYAPLGEIYTPNLHDTPYPILVKPF